MTPNTNHTEVALPATAAEVKKMLRDLGYLLKLSRRVSAEILADREAKKSVFIRASEGGSGVAPTASSSPASIQLHS